MRDELMISEEFQYGRQSQGREGFTLQQRAQERSADE